MHHRPLSTARIGFRDLTAVLAFCSLISLVLLAVAPVFVGTDAALSWGVVTLLPVIVVVVLLIASEVAHRPFSLHLVHLIALFIFMGLGALVQITSHVFPHQAYAPSISDADVVIANFIVALWLASYYLGYRFVRPFAGLRATHHILWKPVGLRGLLVITGIAVLALGYLASQGLVGIWTRDAYHSLLGAESTAEFLLVSVFVRGIPIVALGALLLAWRRMPRHRLVLSVLIALLTAAILLVDNPLAAPRYWTAMVALGLFTMLFLYKRRGTGGPVLVILIVGMLVFMPILDVGRYTTSPREMLKADIPSIREHMTTGHFDAYSNMIYTVKFVDQEGVTYGRQFLGSLLFWVPRSMWPDKPVGSGHAVATYFGFPNTNIAMPLAGEGFVNFGLIGVVGLGLLFGLCLRFLDNTYHARRRTAESGSITLIESLYPFWLGLVLFMSRGDLMSSFAYAVGFTAASLPLLLVRTRKSRQARPAVNHDKGSVDQQIHRL